MVPQRVSKIRPGLESLDDAADAYLSARYDDCLDAVYGDPTAAAVALTVRSLIRLRREREAVGVADSALAGQLSAERLGELLSLKGTAQLCMSDLSEAQATLTQARTAAYRSRSSAVKAEAEYALAILHWSQGRYDEIGSDVERIMALSQEPTWHPDGDALEAYVGSMPEVRAKALDLLGARAAVRENYEEQAALITMAFEEMDGATARDRFFESRLLLNFAVLARDLDFPGSHEFVSKRLATFEFNAYTKLAEFHIRRAVGWCNASRGNHLGAFREFRLSADAAPSAPWRIIAILDRALLARELHERHSAQEELDYALRLAGTVEWQSTRDEERTALFILAQHLAPIDAVKARRLLDQHAAISSPMPITSFADKDRRLLADFSYANAQVLRAEGDEAGAISALLECYDVWTQIGYTSRAACVAADLAELTGKRHYFEVAAKEAGQRPNSWFANRLSSLAS